MDAAIIIQVSVFLVVLGLLGFIIFQMRKGNSKNYTVTSHYSPYTKYDSNYSPYYTPSTTNVAKAPSSSKDTSDKKSANNIDTDLFDGDFDGGGSSFDWD